MATFLSCAALSTQIDYQQSTQYKEGKFHNSQNVSSGTSNLPKIIWRYLTDKRKEAVPTQIIPLETLTKQQLKIENDGSPILYRLGHSSLLLALSGEFWLIDPVFSERASPFSMMGPKRFHPTPISLMDLPEIKGIIISHDHYDHLDKESITVLKDKAEHFLVPLGVGEHLKDWGVLADKIQELDWWQQVQLGDINITATPSQHFSGRGITDGNKTLWASWVIKSPKISLFYSGDSGYFEGFKQIGERLGPFDLTIMENGAYNELWADIHMQPEETLQAHIDLKGKAMLPVHNSTFDLSLHDWHEPLNRLNALSQKSGVTMITPIIGQKVELTQPENYQVRWWQDKVLMPQLAQSEIP
jgi:L-ascorbate metabolism protein UlaG (beta-lactamase superfamily)